MKILLDTHIWIWRLLEPQRIPKEIGAVLDVSGNQLFLSPISVWETLVLARKRRLRLEPDPARWVRRALQESRLDMVPLTHQIAIKSEQLTGLSSDDPADKFLVATAIEEGMAMATADRALCTYSGLDTL